MTYSFEISGDLSPARLPQLFAQAQIPKLVIFCCPGDGPISGEDGFKVSYMWWFCRVL